MTNIAQLSKSCFYAAEIVSHYVGCPEDQEAIRDAYVVEEKVYDVFKQRILAKIVEEGIPLLFLDIDGVINPYHSVTRNKIKQKTAELFPGIQTSKRHNLAASATYFSQEALNNLNHIRQSFTDMAIVLSTDWKKSYTLLAVKTILSYSENTFADCIIDKTPDALSPADKESSRKLEFFMGEREATRCTQIFRWLEDNNLVTANYIVLDDLFLSGSNERFIWVGENKMLLSAENAARAVTILQTNPSCPLEV